MPLTNDHYCEGVAARRSASSGELTKGPYPTGSIEGWAWTRGFLAEPRTRKGPEEAIARIAREGVQGHNMREIALSWEQL